jgi:hypothetical protein
MPGSAIPGADWNSGGRLAPGRGFTAARRLKATRPPLPAAAIDEPHRLRRTSDKQPSTSDGHLSCLCA